MAIKLARDRTTIRSSLYLDFLCNILRVGDVSRLHCFFNLKETLGECSGGGGSSAPPPPPSSNTSETGYFSLLLHPWRQAAPLIPLPLLHTEHLGFLLLLCAFVPSCNDFQIENVN
ncbi:hypothetical protein LINPERPRIM_LOCUS28934 [Linum perenne]